jgi:hypothetical protein
MKTRLASVKSAAVCALREPDACMECHCVSHCPPASWRRPVHHDVPGLWIRPLDVAEVLTLPGRVARAHEVEVGRHACPSSRMASSVSARSGNTLARLSLPPASA